MAATRSPNGERMRQVAVRVKDSGIEYIETLAAERTEVEAAKVLPSDVHRRMLHYAARYMPRDYLSGPLIEEPADGSARTKRLAERRVPASKTPTKKGRKAA